MPLSGCTPSNPTIWEAEAGGSESQYLSWFVRGQPGLQLPNLNSRHPSSSPGCSPAVPLRSSHPMHFVLESKASVPTYDPPHEVFCPTPQPVTLLITSVMYKVILFLTLPFSCFRLQNTVCVRQDLGFAGGCQSSGQEVLLGTGSAF